MLPTNSGQASTIIVGLKARCRSPRLSANAYDYFRCELFGSAGIFGLCGAVYVVAAVRAPANLAGLPGLDGIELRPAPRHTKNTRLARGQSMARYAPLWTYLRGFHCRTRAHWRCARRVSSHARAFY